MNIDQINLAYFQEDHASKCSYCNKAKSYSLGFLTDKLYPSTYQSMMDRGWRRCGTYYYKYNFALNCCLAYTIRANALLSKQKKGQRKIAKNFVKLVQFDLLKNQVDDLQLTLQLISNTIKQEQQSKTLKKQHQGQEQLNQKEIKPKQKMVQEKQLPQIILLISFFIRKLIISEEIINSLKLHFQQFQQFISQNISEIVQLFKEYFESKELKIEEVQSIFQFNVNIDIVNTKLNLYIQLKYFHPKLITKEIIILIILCSFMVLIKNSYFKISLLISLPQNLFLLFKNILQAMNSYLFKNQLDFYQYLQRKINKRLIFIQSKYKNRLIKKNKRYQLSNLMLIIKNVFRIRKQKILNQQMQLHLNRILFRQEI